MKYEMMEKFNGLRPQDVLVLLKITTFLDDKWLLADIASSLAISLSETSNALERCRICGLIDQRKRTVNRLAMRDFLIYGLKYVYPAQVGGSSRGIPTANSAEPIRSRIVEGSENLVWPYYKGTRRGNAVTPLYPTVPKIVEHQPALYEWLVIVDTLRLGKAREKSIAVEELEKRLNVKGE